MDTRAGAGVSFAPLVVAAVAAAAFALALPRYGAGGVRRLAEGTPG